MHPAVYQFKLAQSQGCIKDQVEAVPVKFAKIATAREALVVYVTQLMNDKAMNETNAINLVIKQCKEQTAPENVYLSFDSFSKAPKASTVRLWLKQYQSEGKSALIPKWSGTHRAERGWELLALALYHRPQKPSLRKVARDLREIHQFKSATDSNVYYFFETLPENLKDKSPWRMGRKQYNDGLKEHVKRTTETIPVGFLFQGDGHCVDQYVKHYRTGKIWRVELTIFMDIKSRYIAGWYISDSESSISTMAALSHAMGTYDHVPAMLHIDNGSGFRSRLMNDETAGFYANFGIQTMFALPGNAKSKNVERFFLTMENDFGKDWDTYCGYDMSKDESRNFDSKKLAKLEAEGKIKVPSLEEWEAQFSDWLIRYHNRPHPEYKNTTPMAMWASLENVPVVDHNMLVKPRETVTVHRSLIRLHNRYYRNEFLPQFEGKTLIAEYDLHDDSSIRVFDEQGRLLCIAELKDKQYFLSESRIEDAKRTRLIAQNKRLDNKKRENELRASPNGSLHVQQADQLQSLDNDISKLEDAKLPANDILDLHTIANQMMLEDEIPDDSDEDFKFIDFYKQN